MRSPSSPLRERGFGALWRNGVTGVCAVFATSVFGALGYDQRNGIG